jgi:hypothetical protein
MKQQLAVLVLSLSTLPAHAGFVLNFFGSSSYDANTAAMQTNLGTTGYLIENFEDTTLIAGLSIVNTGGLFGAGVTWNSLPATFDPGTFAFTVDNAWDGKNAMLNMPGNTTATSTYAQLTEFKYAPGATSMGIGMSNFQSTSPASPFFPITNHELFVNGVSQGVIETLAGAKLTPGIVRNVYLRIDATGGDTISSIGIKNISGPDDAIVFDHLAVQGFASPVPEPGGILLAGIGLAILGFRRR